MSHEEVFLVLETVSLWKVLWESAENQHHLHWYKRNIQGRAPSGSVQFSRVWLLATPWTAARQTSLSITNSQSLLKLMSIESVMPSNHLILCRPLLLLPSIFPSIRVFSNEWGLCIRWPKYWSFGINSSNEYSGLISFRRNCYSSKVYTIYYLSLDLLHPKHCTTLIRAL